MEDAEETPLGPVADELLSLVADGVIATDANGRVTLEVGTDGVQTFYGYDADGNRTLLARASGDTVRFEYDSSGRQMIRSGR